MPNRLADQTSPYLLQHADNPVNWYPWDDDAFQRARDDDRPVLLSIGYSACHWCHVMERESFQDPETARLMNDLFVNVKVDREERPDVDSIYMTAVQTMTGHGGWPLTVFLTPDGAPFYGGTYFPPEPRHGLPSFRQLLVAIDGAYRQRRDEVDESAAGLRDALVNSTRLHAPVDELEPEILDQAYQGLAKAYDHEHGGFGGAPKFPQPVVLEFLLRHYVRTGNEDALGMTTHALDAMARGGIHDHLGGGFHRYAVDVHWLVPHFEKMLYDNALLARVYLHAFQATGRPDLRRVAQEVLDYVLREMTSPEGAFYSAQDADSEGVEGKFYVWTPDEIDSALGPEDARLFQRYYGVTAAGNFEGRNILHVQRDLETVAADAGVSVEELEAALRRSRDALYQARSSRVWPALDDKVLTAWNAMMLQAFATAARVLDHDRYREAASRNAEFLLRQLRPDGQLSRTWRSGVASIDGFLEDHALLGDALLTLYEATFDPRWVREARAIGDTILARFRDADDGAFYDTAADSQQLVVRPRHVDDNPTPAGNSAATLFFLRLSVYTGEQRYEDVARHVLTSMAGLLRRAPLAFGHLLAALEYHLASPQEIVIVGEPGAADTRALLDVVRETYRPNTVLALSPTGSPEPGEAAGDGVAELIPLLADRRPIDGRATAWVCHRFACRQPVTGADELRAELAAP